jgi:ankyrin repeat protein
VLRLLDNGANVRSPNHVVKKTYVCICKGVLSDVLRLLDNGANVHSPNYDGITSLHFAAARGHADVVTALLHRGADIEATTM